mmetsp:Transcript_27287/g.49577  ORF Transcript_27287/g.49577 Transcript_27287/m.49577 type:complete len:205 (-) Transcript_27287:72-686(-)
MSLYLSYLEHHLLLLNHIIHIMHFHHGSRVVGNVAHMRRARDGVRDVGLNGSGLCAGVGICTGSRSRGAAAIAVRGSEKGQHVGRALPQTLRGLFARLFLAHVHPDAVLRGALAQEATPRILVAPKLHHLPRHHGLVYLGRGQIPHLVIVHQLAKFHISRVIVRPSAPSAQHIMLSRLPHHRRNLRLGFTHSSLPVRYDASLSV